MPELPEVEALAEFLRERAAGHAVAGVAVGAIAALKTYEHTPDELVARPVDAVARFGKHLGLDVDGTWLVFHLARAGWLRWHDQVPSALLRPGKSPVALRVGLDDGSGFDLTEAGTQKRLALWIVTDPAQVPSIASLGPEPLRLGVEELAGMLARQNHRIKGVLRDQSVIAGIGNAYSDEILHAARLSPYAMAARLSSEEVTRLHTAMHEVLGSAVAAARGKPASQLKDAKRAAMAVHGREGQPCPACGDQVRSVTFADSSLQYCATCQTGGTPLADRRMSRLLR